MSKSEVSIRFYPGEVTLRSDEVVGARRTGGGRMVLCWWEVIHTVALTDIYPERYISPTGALHAEPGGYVKEKFALDPATRYR